MLNSSLFFCSNSTLWMTRFHVPRPCLLTRYRSLSSSGPSSETPTQPVISAEEVAPILIQQQAVGLERIADGLPVAAILLLKLNQLGEERQTGECRLAALKREHAVGIGVEEIGIDEALEGFQGHAAGRQRLVGIGLAVQVETVGAIEVADRGGRLDEQRTDARRGATRRPASHTPSVASRDWVLRFTAGPVFDPQLFYPSKRLIVGDQDGSQRDGVSADHHIEVPHRLAFAFERGTDLPVVLGCFRIPGQDRHSEQEFIDDGPQACGVGPPRCSIAQLAFGYGGNGELRHRHLDYAAANGGNVALDDVTGDVGVQQVPARHRNSLRF